MEFLFLALYRSLRRGNLVPALFGTGVGVFGLVLLLAGGLPAVAFSKISDVFHAAGATPQDQATLGLVWQGVQGVFNETDTVGFILLTIGFILLGVAMLRSQVFGKITGGVSIALAFVGLVGISLFSVDSTSTLLSGS